MKNFNQSIRHLIRQTKGVSTVEYLIILALVAIVGMAAWKQFGGAVSAKAVEASNTVNGIDVKGT